MYIPIPAFDQSLLNTTEAYIHRASQFLAMMGKNYLPDEPDDSNANLSFDPKLASIVGRVINGASDFSLNLNIPNWQLEIVIEGNVKSVCKLAGKLKNEIFDWLRNEITGLGLDPENIKYIDHYEVPEHEVNLGQPFQELNLDVVNLWLTIRSNANLLMSDLNEIVGISSDIRIWPHHFDTGTYYELGEKKAIGAGWAIEDSLCDNPYLYIYGWDGNSELDYSSLPDLEIGKWIVTDDWQGAVIESVQLSTSNAQHESAKHFMETVVEFLKKQLVNS